MQVHPIMLHKSAFFRTIAIPACLLWGVLEFVALQRSRFQAHFTHTSPHPLRQR